MDREDEGGGVIRATSVKLLCFRKEAHSLRWGTKAEEDTY